MKSMARPEYVDPRSYEQGQITRTESSRSCPFEFRFCAPESGQIRLPVGAKAKAIESVLHAIGDDRDIAYDGIAGTVHLSIKIIVLLYFRRRLQTRFGMQRQKGKITD